MFGWKNRYLEATLKLERELREQIAQRDQRVADLAEELKLLRGKCDRMELVLMPLSSAAGAAYARPNRERQPVAEVLPNTWQAELKKFMESEDAKDGGKADAS